MKRLLSIALALTLMGTSVAMARGYQGGSYGDRGYNGYNGYSTPYRGGNAYRERNNDGAVAVGAGILALGLFAALASHNSDHYSSSYYAPPPRSGYGGYGPGYGSNPGYGYGYGGGYYGYGR